MKLHPRLGTAASCAGTAGSIGLVTVLLAGPASALDPIDPGGGRSVLVSVTGPAVVLQQASGAVSDPGSTPVREAAADGTPSHVDAGALGGVAVLLAAAAALGRKGAKRADTSSASR